MQESSDTDCEAAYRRRFRDAFYRQLLIAGRFLIIAPIVIHLALLTAGTFLVPDIDNPSASRLALKSLAMISYDGIIPANKTPNAQYGDPDFLFKLYKFPNAFNWECPNCPPSVHTAAAGVSQVGPWAGADPMALMLQIADAASGGGPGSVSECYKYSRPGNPNERTGCPENVFFEAWRKSFDFGPPSQNGLFFVTLVMAVLVGVMTLANEVLIAFAPRHMKCRCIVWKGICPYPKGTAAEIEAMPEHKWDRIRVWVYNLTMAYFLLPAFHGSVFPEFFLSFLRRIDRGLPKDVSMWPKKNLIFRQLLWISAAMSALAAASVALRCYLSKPKRHISLDDLAAIESGRVRPTAAVDAAEVAPDVHDDEPESAALLPPSYSELDAEPVHDDRAKFPAQSSP